ncbi:hypothetical protein ABH922_005731 [Rhodococcus sp. 27YEA15]
MTKGKFGMNTPGAVGAMGGGVNLGDQLCQRGMSQ